MKWRYNERDADNSRQKPADEKLVTCQVLVSFETILRLAPSLERF